ncbi:Ig-like domain-containing protein [Nocardioides humilatus]|uniref:Ig-like domain-containing protein n=1 Tax=Nocardioides humilatus TaxID=2607660 RepID=UPI00165F69A9|nr:Ig-like domain-containing protein [Nocardioides humilatus]
MTVKVRLALAISAALIMQAFPSAALAATPAVDAPCTIRGTNGPDTLTGTSGNDVICGFGGADQLNGLGGDDLLNGGPGNDTLDGGDGNDDVRGGDGDDASIGGAGDDILQDRDGAGFFDTMSCGDGNDVANNDHWDVADPDCEDINTIDRVKPTAVADVRTINEDVDERNIEVLDNDTDPDGGPIRVEAITQPPHGTVRIALSKKRVFYVPDPDFCNTPPGTSPDTFTYTLYPGGSTAQVKVKVACRDDEPVAVGDTASVAEDAAATTVDVLANDTDVDGGPKSIGSVTQPTHGTVAITSGGADLTYEPDPGYCNSEPGGTPTDDFTYTLGPGTSTATVAVTVVCGDLPATAVDDVKTIDEDDDPRAIDVLLNDDPGDHAPIYVDTVTQPDHGTVVVTNGGEEVTYEPDAGYCNSSPGGTPTDDFTYTLTPDGDTANVAVTVTCVDDPAVAADDAKTVTEDDAATTVDVLANDDPGDHAPVAIDTVTQPAHGAVVITNGGADLTYAPAADYCNSAPGGAPTDDFTYTLVGGAEATVAVTVTCANDAPVLGAVEGTALSFTENASAAPITATGTVTDIDSTNFGAGSLTIDFSAGGLAEDRLEIRNQGTGAGQIGVAATDVSYGGVVIGSFTGGTTGSTPLVITLNASATPAATEALLRNITYRDVSDTPSTASRTVRFVLTDGDGGTSSAATRGVTVVAVNDSPSISGVEGGALAYTENAAATVVTAIGAVSDVDSADFGTGVLTVDYFAGGQAEDRLEIRNQGTAAGQVGVSGADVTYGGVTAGSFTGGSGTTPLVITFNGSADPTVVTAVLRNVTYRNVSDNPSTSARTVRFVVTDGDGGTSSSSAIRVVTVGAVNDNPAISGVEAGALAYSENAAATVVTATGAVSDVDSADFGTGVLTVDYSAGGHADDRLEIRNQGTSAGQVGVSGSNVTYGGTTVGSFAGGSGTTSLTITFSVSATPTIVTAVLRNVTYRNVSDNPSTASRTVRFVVTDGDGGTSGAATRAVTVGAANDSPSITGIEVSALTYNENNAAAVITPNGVISDVDSDNYDTGTLTIDFSAGGQAEDRLEIRNEGTGTGQIGISGSNVTYGGSVTFGTFAGGTGTTPLVITLNNFATQSRTQALLRNITYRNVSDAPITTARTVRFILADGDGANSAPATRGVTVNATNDAPVVTVDGGSIGYTENGSAITVAPSATVSDVDNANIASATISIGSFEAGMVLAVTSLPGTATQSYNSGTGVLTISGGTATVAQYQAALRTLRFSSTAESFTASSTAILFLVNDGAAGSAGVARTVTLGNVNDAPTIADASAASTYVEQNSTASLVTPGLTVTDVDNANVASATVTISSPIAGDTLTFTNQNGITGSFSSGVLTLTGTTTKANYQTALRSVGFRNTTSDAPGGSRAFSVVINDGTVPSGAVARTITISQANDAPVVNLDAASGLTYAEQAGFVNLFGAAATITDPDSTTLGSLKVTVSAGFDGSFDTVQLNPAVTGFGVTFTGGVLTLTKVGGTLAEYQNALRNVQFRNTSEDPDHRNDGTANPTDANRAMSVVANDGAANSSAVTRAVTISPVNDAPGPPSVMPSTTGVRNTDLASDLSDLTPHVERAVNFVGSATDPDGLESNITVAPVTDAATAQGGLISIQANGAFVYHPPASASLASDTYAYVLTDGTSSTSPITFTVSLSGAVWYAAPTSPGGSGNGTVNRPFNTIAAALTAAGPGEPVFVFIQVGGLGMGGALVLSANDKLFGSGASLTNTDVGSATAETIYGSGGPAPFLAAPSGSDVITLASGSQVRGLNVLASGANALSGANTPGVVLSHMTIYEPTLATTQPSIEMTGSGNGLTLGPNVTLRSKGAGALALTNTALSGTVASVEVNASTTSPGISLTNTTGSLAISSVAITTTDQPGVLLSNATGITVAAGTVASTNRPAVNATGLAVGTSLTFTSVSSTNSTTNGVILDGTDTAWGFSAGAASVIQGSAQNAFDLNHGTGTVSYAGSIATPAAVKLVEVTARAGGATTFSGSLSGGGIVVLGNTGGTTTFSGTTKTINTGTTIGVNLASNTGSTIAFSNGGLDIDTTTGAGFVANAGGTVEITGTNNTIQTTSGTGINITSTTIGAAGVTFQAISANGAANGIMLNSPGKTGSFTVTGTGAVDSGGTIANTTGVGISLTNTGPVSLNRVRLEGTNRSAVRGAGVSGFSFTNGTILTAGDAWVSDTDAAIAFNDTSGGLNNNLDGVVTITGNTITTPRDGGIDIRNFAGTITNAVISNNTITTNGDPFFSKGDGIALLLRGSASTVASLTKATIATNTISGVPSGNGIRFEGGNGATSGGPSGTYGTPGGVDLVAITGNLVTGDPANRAGGSAIVTRMIGRGQGRFSVTSNGTVASPLSNTALVTILLENKGSGTVWFNASGNRVTANNTGVDPGIGLATGPTTQGDASTLAAPVTVATINTNTVTNTAGPGIQVYQADSNGSLDLRVQDNVTSNINSGQSFAGIVVNNGSNGSGSFNPRVCAQITGNDAASANTAIKQAGINLSRISTTAPYAFGLVGLAPSPATNATTESYAAGLNPLSDANPGGKKAEVRQGDNYTSCTLPAMP